MVLLVVACTTVFSTLSTAKTAVPSESIWENGQPSTEEEQAYFKDLKRKAKRLSRLVDNSPKQRALEKRLRKADSKEALSVLKDDFPDFLKENQELFGQALDDSAIIGYTGSNSARVRIPGRKKPGLLMSTAPLRVEKNGELKPFDLKPKLHGNYFEPVNGIIDLRLPLTLQDEISVGETGADKVQLTLEGVSDESPGAEPVKDNLFYANVYEDTDFILQPKRFGLQIAAHIRSTEAPIVYGYLFSPGPEQSIELERGQLVVKEKGEQISQMAPPTASDRHGRPLDTKLELEGNLLTVSVNHRVHNYAYPILLKGMVSMERKEESPDASHDDGNPSDDGDGGSDDEEGTLTGSINCSEGVVRQRQNNRENSDWEACYGFDQNSGSGGWAFRVDNDDGRPNPDYLNGLYANCPEGTGHRGLCIATKNFTYQGGLGEHYLAAPPTTYFNSVLLEGRYEEREYKKNHEWLSPDQCVRVALTPSQGTAGTVYDTGFTPSQNPAHFTRTEGEDPDTYTVHYYPFSQAFPRVEGYPLPTLAVFRLHACGRIDPEVLGEWYARGRLELAQAILIDEDIPTGLSAWGSLWDHRDQMAKLGDTYSLGVEATDVGSGMYDSWLIENDDIATFEVSLSTLSEADDIEELWTVPCDYTHQSMLQPCGTHGVKTDSIDTSSFGPGPADVFIQANDYVGNSDSIDWSIHFDGGATDMGLNIDSGGGQGRSNDGYARASWNAVVDEDGSTERSIGIGVDHYEYRYRIDDGNWSSWIETPERKSTLLDNLPGGAEITFQVRSVDQFDNASDATEASTTVGQQPVLGKYDFQTYVTGKEGFFADLTTNMQTGGLLSQAADLDVSALGPDISLTRTYNSAKNRSGGILGYGWKASTETNLLELPDDSVLYDDGQGSSFRFYPSDGSEPCNYGVRNNPRSELPFSDTDPTKNSLSIQREDPTGVHPCIGNHESDEYDRIPGLHLTLHKDGDGFAIKDNQHNTQAFDSEGRLTSLTDRNGNTLTYNYNTRGQLSSITDAANRETVLAYDHNGRLASVTDPLGRTTNYEYTEDHLLRSVQDPAGSKSCFAYDSDDRLARTATPKLVAQDGCESISANDSGLRQGEAVIRYGTDDRVASLTNERHTGGGNQVLIGGTPIGASTTYEWTESVSCNVSAPCTRSPVNATTNYELSSTGQATSQWDPDDRLTTKTYDVDHNPTEVVTDAGSGGRHSTTTMSWNSKGQLTSRLEPGHSQSTTYSYLNGNLVQKKLPSSRTTTYQYDANHNQTHKTKAPGTGVEESTNYAYDGQGNLTSITDSQGMTTTYGYDQNGNRTQVAEPEHPAPSYSVTYNAAGNPINQTDALGNSSTFTWSAGDLLTSQTDTLNGSPNPTHTASIGWSSNKDLISQTDVGEDTDGTTTSSIQTTTHEANKKPSDSTFGVSQGGGAATDTEVDQTLGGSGSAATRVTRDGQGGALGHAYEFTFHMSGTLWIAARSSTDDYVGLYDYDGDYNLLSVNRNESDSVTQTSTVDTANREVSRRFVSARHPLDAIVDQTYSHDEDDRLTTVTDETTPEGNAAYTYDEQGRLSSETVDGQTTSYGYDASGNRTSMVKGGASTTYLYNERDQLSQEQSATETRYYFYDDQGNLIQAQDEFGLPLATYEWDARSRLARVVKSDGTQIDYTYQDRTNLRTTKQVRNASGELTTSIKYEYDTTSDKLATEFELVTGEQETKLAYNYDALGRAVSVTVGDDVNPPTYYYNRSPQGDILAVNNKWGSTVTGGTFRYDTFGTHVHQTGSLYNPIRWRSAYYDEETGLYYLQNRYYDPRIGRYISADPARLSIPTTQRYTYAANDPVNRLQRSGSLLGEEILDPNPYERRLSRTITPAPSIVTSYTSESSCQACEDVPASHWGSAKPKDLMLTLPGQGSALLGADKCEPAKMCSGSGR